MQHAYTDDFPILLIAGQAHPIDFSSLGDLGAMDNFEVEDNELDQYLHSNSAGGRGSGLPPPPPYIPSNPTSSPSVAAAQAWASAYKMSPTAADQLQRMAQSGGPSGTPGGSGKTPESPTGSNTGGEADIGGAHHHIRHPHTGTAPTNTHHTNISNSESYQQQQQQDNEDNSPHSIKMEQAGFSAHFARDKYAFEMQANASRFPFASLSAEAAEMDYGPNSEAAGQYYAQSSAMYSATSPVSPYQCMASGIRSLYQTPGSATPQVAVSPINAATQWDRFTRP